MQPSTGTRRSSRKRSADTRTHFDQDSLLDSSPSRLAKRKKASATTARRPRRLQTPDPEPADDNELDDDVASSADDQNLADTIIPHLETAKGPIVVATQHSNAKSQGTDSVQAYAKFCGRDWTYYVQKVRVVIGRPPDAISHPSSTASIISSPASLNRAPGVDIDLGPSKMISRTHAELLYKDDDQTWRLEVKGRNGVRRNDQQLRKGQESALGCGDVLEIDGTQMMFITAEGPAEIHPMFLNRMQEAPNPRETARANKHSHAHPEPSFPPVRSSPQPRVAATTITPSRSNGRSMIAPAPPDYVKPVTPSRSPKKQPRPNSALKGSPTFKRGYVIETSEQIDFTKDATKDLKPTVPYAVMITQAILSTPEQCLPLNKIYDFITANFAYYRHLTSNWQNSIRHNLSLSPAFEKVARGPNDPGKGMKWRLVDEKRNEMIQAVMKHLKKSGARPPSLTTSPALLRDDVPGSQYAPAPRQQYSSETNGVIKTSPPPGPSPNLSAYPVAQESYTPTRGSRNTMVASHDHSQNVPVLSDDVSPLPIRRNHNIRVGATDSSPVLPSALYDGAMLTPAPRQHNLHFPQPATIKPPTSHMIYSSPAPFWKQAGDLLLGSTPMRGFPETSPLKVSNTDEYQSSSPPPAATNGNESPTKGRGGSTYTMSTLKGDDLDDENEGEIDLTKGFTKISTYHQRRSAGAASGTTA
ncbi:MAG: hypothetical protein L6R36_003646 [Xanthoria steineri]|nr:MAG: hypothetical protein L6R36_003646 [Xanthoria steineri]